MTPLFGAAVDVERFCVSQGWLDVEGVILRQRSRLDTALILEEVAPLLDLKGTLEDLGRLQRLLAE